MEFVAWTGDSGMDVIGRAAGARLGDRDVMATGDNIRLFESWSVKISSSGLNSSLDGMTGDSPMVGVTTVGVSMAGVSTAGASTAGVSTAGVSTTGVSTAGVSTAGASTAGVLTVSSLVACCSLVWFILDGRSLRGAEIGTSGGAGSSAGLLDSSVRTLVGGETRLQ